MRDIALSIFIFGLLPVVLMRPYVGALLWAWIGIMAPHRFAFGFAQTFPFAAIVACTTLFATVMSKEQRKPFPWGPIPVLIILMVAWMSFTSLFAMAPAEEVYDAWIRVVKIHLMLLVTLMLIRGRAHIEQLVWVLVISLGFFGLKGGVWTVLTGGGERVYGPRGGVIEGNNELALALVLVVPLMYYLMSTTPRRLVKLALLGLIVMCGFSILGSHSRGAFLAIIACVGMLALKSRRPLLVGVLGGTALVLMFAFMPEHWTSRMNTIGEYQGESSAMSRLYTWHTLWNVALDRPLVGAGFVTAQEEIFQKYAPQFSTVHASHSIYFQALGEHGFVGLGLFLALLAITVIRAGRLARRCRDLPGYEWGDLLMRMVQVSVVAFAVGGAFLSLLHFDVPYYLMALVVLLEATLKEQTSAFSVKSWAATRNPSRNATGQSPAVRG